MRKSASVKEVEGEEREGHFFPERRATICVLNRKEREGKVQLIM